MYKPLHFVHSSVGGCGVSYSSGCYDQMPDEPKWGRTDVASSSPSWRGARAAAGPSVSIVRKQRERWMLACDLLSPSV